MARIDRGLTNSQWASLYINSSIYHLNRSSSDHAPLLLSIKSPLDQCPKVFKFQHMWTTHENFENIVQTSWNEDTCSFGLRKFSIKLRKLKEVLKKWNKKTFGDIFQAVRDMEDEVLQLEVEYENDRKEENRIALDKGRVKLLEDLKREKVYWKKKSTIKWVQQGDANTSYFHSSEKA